MLALSEAEHTASAAATSHQRGRWGRETAQTRPTSAQHWHSTAVQRRSKMFRIL